MSIDLKLAKDDLYQAVNGEWLEEAVIPDDRSSTGGFTTLRDNVEDLLREDVSKMANGEIELTNPEQVEFIKYYQQASDFEEHDRLGAQPIKPYLEQIEKLDSFSDLEDLAVDWLLKGFTLPFSLANSSDMKNAQYYALYLDVPGNILPDKTYYGTESGDQLLAIYQEMSINVLTLMDYSHDQAQKLVKDTLEFDRSMVDYVKTSEELADYTKDYNPRTPQEVEEYSDYLSFNKIIRKLLKQEVDQVIVTQPVFFENYNKIVNEETFQQLKSWMLVKTANSVTGYLSEEIRQAGGVYSLALSGNESLSERDVHAFRAATGVYDHVIGDYYAKRYFGPDARSDVEEMVQEMIKVYEERLANNDWLSQQTIEKAIVKLEGVDILVGYPDDYPDIYREYKVDEGRTYFENTLKFSMTKSRDHYDRWGKKINPKEWHMSADTVNAYYSPSTNVICFPAAILQAPFYDYKQSRSANYGGIGAVIGHEISHAFDNNGAQFDEFGNMNNWWSDEDWEAFDEKRQDMIDFWDGVPFGSGQVNGSLTVSENIADGGGLTAACEALKKEDQYDLQEFFINWARVWCQKARPEYVDLLLSVDVHAPSPLRGNLAVRNIDDFHEAFQTQAGDGMYLAPEDRVVIW